MRYDYDVGLFRQCFLCHFQIIYEFQLNRFVKGIPPFSLNNIYVISYTLTRPPCRMKKSNFTKVWHFLAILGILISDASAIHHMRLPPVILDTINSLNRSFRITNHCPVDIYPAIQTQAGEGPAFGGYHAVPGNTTNFNVSGSWQGRIWARTNCTFNANGTSLNGTGNACLTGDCEGLLNCDGTVRRARCEECACRNSILINIFLLIGSTGYAGGIHHVRKHEAFIL